MEDQAIEKLKKALAYQSDYAIGFVKNLTDELLFTVRTETGKAKRLLILNKMAKELQPIKIKGETASDILSARDDSEATEDSKNYFTRHSTKTLAATIIAKLNSITQFTSVCFDPFDIFPWAIIISNVKKIVEEVESEPPSQIVKPIESAIDISLLSMDSVTFQEDANTALAAIEERIQTLESESAYIKESIHHLEEEIKMEKQMKGQLNVQKKALQEKILHKLKEISPKKVVAPQVQEKPEEVVVDDQRAVGQPVNLIVYYYERFQIIPLILNMTVEENIKLAIHHLGELVLSTPGKEINYSNFGFFLPFPANCWLKNSEKLSKYNLKDGRELELKERESSVAEKAETEEFALKVRMGDTDPSRNTIASIGVKVNNKTSTVAEVLDTVTRKCRIDDPENYGLMTFDGFLSQSGLWLDESKKISNYQLKHNQVLLLKKKPDNNAFGVEPSSMPMAIDASGLKVPAVLQAMKVNLLANNGLEFPRIFVKGADPVKSKQIRQRLNMGIDYAFENPEQVHCLAHLIKEWYRELPVKILQSLKIQDLAFYTKNEATALKIFDLLLEPQKSLLRWILDLMVETVKYAEHNQVSPRDIGIAIAPTLLPISQMSPDMAIEFCRNVAAIVYYIVGTLALDAIEGVSRDRTGMLESPNYTRDEIRSSLNLQ